MRVVRSFLDACFNPWILADIDIDKMVVSTLLTKLSTRDRPIPEPYKFLQAALHELRAFVVAFEPEEGRAAVLAALDRLISRAEALRRLPR